MRTRIKVADLTPAQWRIVRQETNTDRERIFVTGVPVVEVRFQLTDMTEVSDTMDVVDLFSIMARLETADRAELRAQTAEALLTDVEPEGVR